MTGQQIELSLFGPQIHLLCVFFCVGVFFVCLWFVCLFSFWLVFLFVGVFCLNKGQHRLWLTWSVCNIWQVKWLLPQKRKGANHNCLWGWGHSVDLILHPIDFFWQKPWTLPPFPPPEKQPSFTPLFLFAKCGWNQTCFPETGRGWRADGKTIWL